MTDADIPIVVAGTVTAIGSVSLLAHCIIATPSDRKLTDEQQQFDGEGKKVEVACGKPCVQRAVVVKRIQNRSKQLDKARTMLTSSLMKSALVQACIAPDVSAQKQRSANAWLADAFVHSCIPATAGYLALQADDFAGIAIWSTPGLLLPTGKFYLLT